VVSGPPKLNSFDEAIGPSSYRLEAIVVDYFYMVNRVKREEARLRRLFGPEYEAYCRRVNRFVPRIGYPAPGFGWSFNFRLLVENNGHWNLIAMLSAYSLFYFSRVLVLRFPS